MWKYKCIWKYRVGGSGYKQSPLFTGYGKVLQQLSRYTTISCGGGKNIFFFFFRKTPIHMPKEWRLLWRSGQIREQSEWRSESSIHVEQTLRKNPWQNLQQMMQLIPCGIYSADLQRVNLLLSAHWARHSDFRKITDNMQCNSIKAIGVDIHMQISSPT